MHMHSYASQVDIITETAITTWCACVHMMRSLNRTCLNTASVKVVMWIQFDHMQEIFEWVCQSTLCCMYTCQCASHELKSNNILCLLILNMRYKCCLGTGSASAHHLGATGEQVALWTLNQKSSMLTAGWHNNACLRTKLNIIIVFSNIENRSRMCLM